MSTGPADDIVIVEEINGDQENGYDLEKAQCYV